MCNQYSPADPHLVTLHFKVDPPAESYKPGISPWGRGLYVRASIKGRGVVVGHWALIGDNAREARSPARIMTNNAGPSRWPRSRRIEGPGQGGSDA